MDLEYQIRITQEEGKLIEGEFNSKTEAMKNTVKWTFPNGQLAAALVLGCVWLLIASSSGKARRMGDFSGVDCALMLSSMWCLADVSHSAALSADWWVLTRLP